jgi:hypothetical protein
MRNYCTLAALIASLAGAPALRAEHITPDSIPSPPPISPAIDGQLAPGGWVSSQYASLGLNFPFRMTGVDTGLGTALVRVNGVTAWTGGNLVDGGILGGVSFSAGVKAELVVPNTQTPTTADSLRLHLVAAGGTGVASALVDAFDAKGNVVLEKRTSITEDAAGTWVDLSAPGIHSFEVTASPDVIPGNFPLETPFSWGVAAIDFQAAPEPTSLALAGFGLAGLAGWAWRRRPAGLAGDSRRGRFASP